MATRSIPHSMTANANEGMQGVTEVFAIETAVVTTRG